MREYISAVTLLEASDLLGRSGTKLRYHALISRAFLSLSLAPFMIPFIRNYSREFLSKGTVAL